MERIGDILCLGWRRHRLHLGRSFASSQNAEVLQVTPVTAICITLNEGATR